MNHPIDEQVSAYLDGELESCELPMFTAQVARNPALRRKLARYALIGDCLRGDLRLDMAALGVADRVREVLAAEPGVAADPPGPARTGTDWRRPALGVAAGVAIAAALLLQLQPGTPTTPQQPVVASVAPTVLPAIVTPGLARRGEPATMPRPARADVRMTNYLVYHGEYAGMLSSRAVASRIVDQDSGTRWVRQVALADD